MSYNGSGTFTINSTGQPVVAGTVITASAFNALTADLATGLTTAITKDGQTTTTAQIPFAQGLRSTLATDSSSVSTGSIITDGGMGVAKNLYVGGTLNVTGSTSLTNPVINNIKMGYSTTATAAGTTTLTVSSNYRQFFTGTLAQTIVLPVTSTLVTGMAYEIENNSTGLLTVNSSGGNLVGTIPAGVCAHAVCIGTTLTTAADWDWDYISTTTITGTGANVLGTSPTITTPTISSLSSAAATALTLQSAGTTAITVDTSQNVGIGTTSPNTLLTVQSGNILLRSAVTTGALSSYNLGFSATATGGAAAYVTSYRENANEASSLVFGNWNGSSSGERMRITSAGYVGIGTTSPNSPLVVSSDSGIIRANSTGGTTTSNIGFTNTGGTFYVGLDSSTGGNFGAGAYGSLLYNGANTPMVFFTNGTERMRIDSSGNLLVGGTTISTSFAVVKGGTYGEFYTRANHPTGTPNGYGFADFLYNGSGIGSITQNGTTGVLFNITSDYRLKKNTVALTGAKDFVMALQPKTWDWWDDSGKGVGFIAHEFMEVAKYSGNGEKDASHQEEYEVTPAVKDEEGNITTPAVMGTRTVADYQSIQPSSSEVMANLVAFIQEQQATITALTARITALENA